MVKIRFLGEIISGSKEFRYLGLQENLDFKNDLAGLNILIATNPELKDSYDDWVEDYLSLIEYLKERKWAIKWI